MEEFYFGEVGINNQFPQLGNSIFWDYDTNVTAVTCFTIVRLKDPFHMKQVQTIEIAEKNLHGLDEVGQIFKKHSYSGYNIIKDPYVLSPELNFWKSARIVEHTRFSPLFYNRKFLTVLTNDCITRVYEKSMTNDFFKPSYDLHPLLMNQDYGLPKHDTRLETRNDPVLKTGISDYKKWGYVSPDVKTKIERNLSYTSNRRRETEVTYGRPEFGDSGGLREVKSGRRRIVVKKKKKKKKKKKRKKSQTSQTKKKKKRKRKKKKKKKKKKLEDMSLVIDSGEYVNKENEITEPEIHELTKYMYETYVKNIPERAIKNNRKKKPRQRWLIFSPTKAPDRKKFVELVVEMWEKCPLAKSIIASESNGRRRNVKTEVVNKEIRSRIRYFLREEIPPPEKYTDLPLGEIFHRNLCVDKVKRKRRQFRSYFGVDDDDDDEEEEEEQEEQEQQDGNNENEKVKMKDEDEDEYTSSTSTSSEEEDDGVPDRNKYRRKQPVPVGSRLNMYFGTSKIAPRPKLKKKKKKGGLMSSILFTSKVDCVNTTCSEWCGSYSVVVEEKPSSSSSSSSKKKRKGGRGARRRRMVDEDEYEEEEEEQDNDDDDYREEEEEQQQQEESKSSSEEDKKKKKKKGGIVAFHLFGTRSGMVSVTACLIPQPEKSGIQGSSGVNGDKNMITGTTYNIIPDDDQKKTKNKRRDKQQSSVDFKFLRYFKVHDSRIVCLHWSNEGSTPFLVTSSSHGAIRIWNFATTTTRSFKDLDPSMVSLTMKCEVFPKDGIPSRILRTQYLRSSSSSPQLSSQHGGGSINLVFPKGNTLIVVGLTMSGDRVSRSLYRSHKGHITGLVLRENHHGNLDAFTTSYDGVLVQWRFYGNPQQHTQHNIQQQQQGGGGRLFERGVLLDDSRKECYYWGLAWSPNKTHVMVACEENPKNLRLKKLSRRNVWKLVPVVTSQNVEEFISTCTHIFESTTTITANNRMMKKKSQTQLSDVMRLVEKQISDGLFMEFADRFDQLCVEKNDYWFNKFVFSILSNMKERFDRIPEMKSLRKRLNCLLRYMNVSDLMIKFITLDSSSSNNNNNNNGNKRRRNIMNDEDEDEEEEDEDDDEDRGDPPDSKLVNVADWILSFHKEIFCGSEASSLMRNAGYEDMYIRDLRSILRHVYTPSEKADDPRTPIIQFINNMVSFYVSQQQQLETEIGNNNNFVRNQQQQQQQQQQIMYESREECPICGEVNPSGCGNLFVDGNHCKCSKNHYYDRDVCSFRIVDVVLGIKKCKYCDSKTLEDTDRCPVCVGVLFPTESELFQKYY